jgi:hypothetical protein
MLQSEAFGWLATIGAMAIIWLVLLDVVPKPILLRLQLLRQYQ